jgi:hypothetical protein
MEENGKLIGKGFAIIASPILAWLLISNIFAVAGLAGLNLWVFLFCLIGFFVTTIYSFYILWAPRDIFTTIIGPTELRIVGLNKKPTRVLFNDPDYKGRFSYWLGNWFAIGLYPFHSLLEFPFRKWESFESFNEKTGEITSRVHPEKNVKGLYIKKYMYMGRLIDAESANENEPISVFFYIIARIATQKGEYLKIPLPIVFAFHSKDPIQMTLLEIIEVMRKMIAKMTYVTVFNEDGSAAKNIKEGFANLVYENLNSINEEEGRYKYASEINKKISYIEYFKEFFGLEVLALGIINLTSKNAEYVQQIFRNQKIGEANLIEAEFYTQIVEKKATGDARAIKKIAKAQAEAIGEAAINMLISEIGEDKVEFLRKNSPQELTSLLKKNMKIAANMAYANRGAFYRWEGNNASNGSFPELVSQAGVIAEVLNKQKNTFPKTSSVNQESFGSQMPLPSSDSVQKEKKKEKKEGPKKNSKESSFENRVREALSDAGRDPDKEWIEYENTGKFSEKAQEIIDIYGIDE